MFQRTGILWKEITLTLRGLRREPGFTLTSLVLLSLGIALTSAVFTLLWQIVYARLPVPDPSRLFTFATTALLMLCSLLAAAVPATRATRMNVQSALRRN